MDVVVEEDEEEERGFGSESGSGRVSGSGEVVGLHRSVAGEVDGRWVSAVGIGKVGPASEVMGHVTHSRERE